MVSILPRIYLRVQSPVGFLDVKCHSIDGPPREMSAGSVMPPVGFHTSNTKYEYTYRVMYEREGAGEVGQKKYVHIHRWDGKKKKEKSLPVHTIRSTK